MTGDQVDPPGRMAWYATSPRRSLVPPWYVWCGIISLLCGVVRVAVGHSPLELFFGLASVVVAVVAWRD